MPKTPEQENAKIETVDNIVQKALEMLLGSGGHQAGWRGLGGALFSAPKTHSPRDYAAAIMETSNKLSSALTVAAGVTTDHSHKGYKEVTMQAFQRGIQRILEDYYVSLKLLEGTVKFDDQHLENKLSDKTNRNHILKILGFNTADRDAINRQIEAKPELDKISVIQGAMKSLKIDKDDRRLRIEMLISGGLGYFPFSEPNDGHVIKMPVKDAKGKYHLEEMRVERINMSPGIGGPYYALQLTPTQEKHHGQNQVVFMGTNPMPTASGPSVTVHADTISGMNVGENFVQATRDQFEKMFKAKFKENLINLTKNHLNDFKNDNGEVDYQKLWLAARVKCTGQSLGGSIPLQMLAKFPHLVEISAFEPPFMLEKNRNDMEYNLEKASEHFKEIVNECKNELPEEVNVKKLGNAVPNDKEDLKAILKPNNMIITQLFDVVTKHGTVSPPAQIYHVDTKKPLSKYSKLKDKVYKGAMAGTVMSHAMGLATQNDKVIKKIDSDLENEYLNLNSKSRKRFTSFLHKAIWTMINPTIGFYFSLKKLILNNVRDPKMDPKKNPKYIEEHKKIVGNELKAKWETIKRAFEGIDDPNGWQAGEHLKSKIEEFSRLKKRADNLKLPTNFFIADLKELQESATSSKGKIYYGLLESTIGIEKTQGLNQIQENIIEKLDADLGHYVNHLQGVNSLNNIEDQSSHLKHFRQNIIEFYSLLDEPHRKIFLSKLESAIANKQLLVTNPDRGLLNDLVYRAQSTSEEKSIKKLMKEQNKELESAYISLHGKIGVNLSTSVEKISKKQLETEIKKCSDHLDKEPTPFEKRVLLAALRDRKHEKEYRDKEPPNQHANKSIIHQQENSRSAWRKAKPQGSVNPQEAKQPDPKKPRPRGNTW